MAESNPVKTNAEHLRLKNPDDWVPRQVIPFAVFIGFLLVLQLADSFFKVDLPKAPWWRKALRPVFRLAKETRMWRNAQRRRCSPSIRKMMLYGR